MTLAQLKYAIAVSDAKSINEAARNLFITQPSLSASIRELESEIGLELFLRTNRGIVTTPDGEEFLGYARQVVQQYELIESRYIEKRDVKKKFSVSMQHYSFAVDAFVRLVRQFGMDEYEFAVRETRTAEVIEDVRSFRSELGVLYLNDFNRKVMTKLFAENNLAFHEILVCGIYVYLWKGHPLANQKEISIEELQNYPCLSFEQGSNNSFYFAEEVLSTYAYKQTIKANDRATMLNLMRGLDGYTLCSGIICEDLNGEDYYAVPLASDELMQIGYICHRDSPVSAIGQKYLEELAKYRQYAVRREGSGTSAAASAAKEKETQE